MFVIGLLGVTTLHYMRHYICFVKKMSNITSCFMCTYVSLIFNINILNNSGPTKLTGKKTLPYKPH